MIQYRTKRQPLQETWFFIKEYKGQGVIIFKEIDMVHGRSEGMDRKNFKSNRDRFVEGVDYFNVCEAEIRLHKTQATTKK